MATSTGDSEAVVNEQEPGKEADQEPEQEPAQGSEISELVGGYQEVVTEANEQVGEIEEQEWEQVQVQVGEIEEHGNGIQEHGNEVHEQGIEEQERLEGQLGEIEEGVIGDQVHVELQAQATEIVEAKGRDLEVSVGAGPGRDGAGEPASGPATPSGTGAGPGTPPVRTRIMDIRSSIVPGEDDLHSRQRMLSFAARRYSRAVAANADDFDAMYNWALVLQETADNTPVDGGPPGKDVLLEDACSKYEAAISICPSLHEAFYNWAIAISDRAKIRGRTKEAEELWKQACEKYEKSLQLNWNSPQALNNWGLALQELGAIVPLKEKRGIIRSAIRKFRAAIGLRFDFHRAVYNLGTVLYGLAEDTLRSGRKVSRPDHMPSELYSQSAIYIAAAHSLKPDYPVYRSALRLVRSMLPLPYLKAGYLLVHPGDDSLAPHNDWKRLWFVIDHEAFYEMDKPEEKLAKNFSRRINPGGSEPSSPSIIKTPAKTSFIRMELEDIVYMTPCADLSLPAGGGLRIDTSSRQQYFVADSWELMEGWLDAIRLAYTITVRGKSEVLAGVLTG